MFKRHCFKTCFIVPNRFKYRQSASFRDIIFKMFSAVPNTFKYHQHAYFRDIAPGSYTSSTSDLIIW